MKKLVLSILCCASLWGQSQTLLQKWATKSNNAAITNSNDEPKFTEVAADGKVAILGNSNGKIILSCYDAFGNDLWTNRYSNAYADNALGLGMDTAGNYYAGYFWSGKIRKISPNGQTEWTTTSNAYHGRCMAVNPNLGITYVIGTNYVTSTIYIDKINTSGNIVQSATYTAYYGLGGYPRKAALDGNGKLLIAIDARDSSGNLRPSVAKFDTGLGFSWHTCATTVTGEIKDIYVDTANNSSYITGLVDDVSLVQEAFILRLGSAGALSWMNTYHSTFLSGNDYGCAIVSDNAGNVYMTALTDAGTKELAVVKYAKAGGTYLGAATTGLSGYLYNLPTAVWNEASHAVFVSYGRANASSDNQIGLWKSNAAFTGLNEIYTYDHLDLGSDYGVDIDLNPDGDIILTGNIYSLVNGNDCYYAKIDTLGNYIFSNVGNGVINGVDEAADIITDNMNLPIVAGSTLSTLSGYDGVLVKYDAYGNEQFFNVYNGPDNLNDKFLAVDTNSAGQYYAAGYVGKVNQAPWMQQSSNMWLMKTDVNGSLLWQIYPTGTATYGDDKIVELEVDNSSNVYAAGVQTNTGTGRDAVLLKANSSGTVMWTKKYTGSGANADAFLCLKRNGNYYYAGGYTTNASGNRDFLVCRYDYLGNLNWATVYDSPQHVNDSVIALTFDVAGNVYVTGRSDSSKVITAKFSNTGAFQWASTEPEMSTVGSTIAVNQNGQVFISCRRDSLYIDWVNVIAYDNNGNKEWTKTYNFMCCEDPCELMVTKRGTLLAFFDLYVNMGVMELDTAGNELNSIQYYIPSSNGDGGSRAMTFDRNGDVYVTGYFKEDAGMDIHTLKLCYTPAPVLITGLDEACMGETQLYAVAPQTGVSTYNWSIGLGADYEATTYPFAVNATFNMPGDVALALVQGNACGNAQPVIKNIHVNALPTVDAGDNRMVCPNSDVTLTASGASSYVWTGGVQNGVPFTVTSSNGYAVTGTDSLGCSNTDTVLVMMKPAPLSDLCIVTVDSLSTHNILVWEKSGLGDDISFFHIYREDITNNYTLIGAVPFDSLSEFHDYGADPNITTKRYKIAAVDTCGTEGLKSPFHNTIFVSENNGTFSWNTYTIQSHPNPVQFYALMRDDDGTGNWQQIATTAGTQNVINDPSYANFPDASWRIETIWNISCTPTRAAINTSRSNIKNARMIGLQNNYSIGSIQVQPNPSNGIFTFTWNKSLQEGGQLEILDLSGRVINTQNVGGNNCTLDLTNVQAGLYYYRLIHNGVQKMGMISKIN